MLCHPVNFRHMLNASLYIRFFYHSSTISESTYSGKHKTVVTCVIVLNNTRIIYILYNHKGYILSFGVHGVANIRMAAKELISEIKKGVSSEECSLSLRVARTFF